MVSHLTNLSFLVIEMLKGNKVSLKTIVGVIRDTAMLEYISVTTQCFGGPSYIRGQEATDLMASVSKRGKVSCEWVDNPGGGDVEGMMRVVFSTLEEEEVQGRLRVFESSE